ncbi:MAG: hypothetical protein ACREUA_03935 [Burkholderiales bacterium]
MIHGIGAQRPDFAQGFIAEMDERLGGLGIAPGVINWQVCYWADLLNTRERELWDKLAKSHDLDWVTVRKFFINVFSDALAYQRRPHASDDMYRRIHARVRESLASLHTALGHHDKPLVIVAHSLGSVIVSNYLWDEQSGKGAGTNAFERMRTLAGLVTFGSNIPLFTLALDEIKAIDFPPDSGLSGKAKWLNFFDADDVLGYPLRGLSDTYRKAVTKDLEINVGGLFSSWNPVSHTAYWTDADFTAPVARQIRDVVKTI